MIKFLKTLFAPRNDQVKILGQITAVLTNQHTGKKRIYKTRNIVTNDGDKYYAQMACGEAPDDDFDAVAAGMRLGTGTTAPDKTDTDCETEDGEGRLDVDAAYPKTNDDDGDNSGAGVDIISWRYSYTTAEGNIADIANGAIVDDRTTPTAALCHYKFAAAFTKTSDDTLKIFVNHEVLGA